MLKVNTSIYHSGNFLAMSMFIRINSFVWFLVRWSLETEHDQTVAGKLIGTWRFIL